MGCGSSKDQKPRVVATYGPKQSEKAAWMMQQQLTAVQQVSIPRSTSARASIDPPSLQSPPVPFTVTEPDGATFVIDASPMETVASLLWRVAEHLGFSGSAGSQLQLVFSEHIVPADQLLDGAGIKEVNSTAVSGDVFWSSARVRGIFLMAQSPVAAGTDLKRAQR